MKRPLKENKKSKLPGASKWIREKRFFGSLAIYWPSIPWPLPWSTSDRCGTWKWTRNPVATPRPWFLCGGGYRSTVVSLPMTHVWSWEGKRRLLRKGHGRLTAGKKRKRTAVNHSISFRTPSITCLMTHTMSQWDRDWRGSYERPKIRWMIWATVRNFPPVARNETHVLDY